MGNQKINIVALIPYKVFPPNMGGQRGIALFYRKLCNIVNLTVYTICDNQSDENFEIINSISNSTLRYINPFVLFKIVKIAKQKNAKYLLFEHPYYAWLIFLVNKFTSLKTIVHSHNIESERFRSIGKPWWKILWHYEKWAYKNADIVWFITEFDKEYAIKKYKINENKTFVIPYGTELNTLPSENEIKECKQIVKYQHHINEDENILLFNGALGYKPNFDAVKNILGKINPLLLASNYKYKIVICGKGLPSEMNELNDYQDKNIIYAGFVDDIDLYFKACDIFINPVIDGGGIKTKLVEALGFGKNAISTKNGAIGINENLTEGRLKIVEDNDWYSFAEAIIHNISSNSLNKTFYDHFSWTTISEKAVNSLHESIHNH